MKEFIKKHRVPVIVVASLVIIALIVTSVLLVQKPKPNKGSEKVETTTTENSTTESAAVVDDGDNVTTEEWVILVAQKFGFNSYISSSPYFEDVKDDSNIFPYVQTMVENEILDAVSGKLGADEEISQKSALIQLSKIYGDTYIENRFEKDELTEEDYINFAVENIGINLTAIEDGFTYTEATDAINKTWEHYLSKEYGNFEKIEYTENVIDLSSVEDYVYENNTVLVSTEHEITEGKILILATQDEYKSLIALKVTAVEKDGNKYILDVTEPTLDDIVVSMNVEFSQIANWDNFIPAEGVTVLDGESVAASGDFNHTGSEKTFEVNFTDKKLKYSDEWEDIYGKLTLNGINIDNVNYFKDSKGNMMSKYKEGVEIVGKITIKDLIIKGYAEYDGNLEFNVESGATISSSLSIKGKKEEQMIRVGELPIYTFGSPFSFVVDVYVVATMEGEIKVEPKVTAIASAKKTKNSGVNFTGDITTSDLNSTISGKVKLAVCPDAVVCFYGVADLMDLYIEAGVGSDAKYDLNDPGKIKIEIYAPTLKAGVGKDKKSILSGVLGIKYDVKIMDKKDALFKCPYIEELVFDVPAIIDYITGENTTTEEPTSETTGNITETVTQPTTQPSTEAPEPTEPVTEAPTQKPTETPTQGIVLSEKGYEAYMYWTENLHCVKENGKWGVVNNAGNVVIPFNYDSVEYANVSKSEIKFIINNGAGTFGNLCVVYNTNIDKIVEYGESDGCVSYDYKDGMYITTTKLSPIAGARVSITNIYSGDVIFEGQASYMALGGDTVEFVSKLNNEAVILLWMAAYDSNGYPSFDECTFVKVTPNGYTTTKCNIEYIFMGHMAYYSNGYFTIFDGNGGRIQINVDTLEETQINLNGDCSRENYETCPAKWYYGNGKYFAFASDGKNFKIYNGNNVLIDKIYTWCDFQDNNYIIAGNGNNAEIIDYSGNVIKTFKDVDASSYNGKRLVYDGTGVYYIDNQLNKISEYIYEGADISVAGGGIRINNKFYFVK